MRRMSTRTPRRYPPPSRASVGVDAPALFRGREHRVTFSAEAAKEAAAQVSKYAATEVDELIAESYKAVALYGDDAPELARVIVADLAESAP